jgi:ribonuclease HI
MYTLHFDGGSRPNPGPTAGAYVIHDPNGIEIYKGGKFIENSTNNVGEYTGLICGLEKCVEVGIKNVLIKGDSSLVINQVSGKWKVNFEHLAKLKKECLRLISLLDNVKYCHVLRKFNKDADAVSTQIILGQKDYYLV